VGNKTSEFSSVFHSRHFYRTTIATTASKFFEKGGKKKIFRQQWDSNSIPLALGASKLPCGRKDGLNVHLATRVLVGVRSVMAAVVSGAAASRLLLLSFHVRALLSCQPLKIHYAVPSGFIAVFRQPLRKVHL